MNYSEIIVKLLALGLSPLPVAPYQDPNDKAHKFHKYLYQSKKVTDPWDNSTTYEPIYEPDGSLKAKFTGKNPSFLSSNGFPKAIEHKNYQKTLPTQEEFEEWFANLQNGIGCLGSHRYRWLDLDRKHFATQGDCDRALLEICPHAHDGWLEQTQSGGYRLLVDCGEAGADFTNFALSEGGDHVGELLGAGRFAVIAPSIGVNGNYTNINYGNPIPLSEINIFTGKLKKAIAVLPILETSIRTESIPLEIVISKAHRDSLRGVYEGSRDNEGAALIRDLIGCNVWLLSNNYSVDGDPYALLKEYCSRCVPPLDDNDCERIYNSALKDNPSPCLSEDKLQNCVDAYLRRNRVAIQDLRYKAPVKADDLNDIDLLSLLPKKHIEAVNYGIDKPSALLPIIKGLAVATEQYLIGKQIKYRGNPQAIFTQFCQNQEPPIVADFDSIPSDPEELDVPTIKKTLAAYDSSQKKIKERIEREALKAERERLKAELKANEACQLSQNIAAIKADFYDRFRLNLLTQDVELDGKIFDIDRARIMFASELDIEINKNDACDVIADIADENSYHPIYDYLESLNSDVDTAILDDLAKKSFGVSNPLYEVFLKKTLIAAVARIYAPFEKNDSKEPTAKVDHVLCLVGKQGAKKSSFFEALAGEEFFTDNLDKELSSKDNLMRLHRKWICEIGEIDRVTNSKYEGDLKNFITIKTDLMRFPYRRSLKVLPRQFLFVGSSNREDFLTDPTGDRRYWLLRTADRIDCAFIRANRDRIWAAAVSLYKSGAEWWLNEVEQEASNHNNRRYQSDSPWMPTVVDFCEFKERVSVTEILYRIEPQKSKHTHLMQRDISNCLTRLGYVKNGGQRHRILIDGSNLQVYSWVLTQDNSPLTHLSNPYPVSNTQDLSKSANSVATHPSNPYSVSDIPTTELLHIHNIGNTPIQDIYIENDDQKTCIDFHGESKTSKSANSVTQHAQDQPHTSIVAELSGELEVSQVEIKTRPVTAADLASATPVMIVNRIDNTIGVLHSLGRDGVRYGDFVAKPQDVGVRVE